MTKEKPISYTAIIKKVEPELEKVVNFFQREVNAIKSSRASPSLVEDIQVSCFGQTFPLKQLAAISLEGPREIVIQPWDESYIEPILNALKERDLGTILTEKKLIRIKLGPISEEFRQNLLKLLSQKKEQAKQTIRKWRQEVWDELQEKEREGKISEDDKYRGKKELQNLVDKFQEKIEEIAKRKEEEILE
jgi:ribosome recycling factor